MVGFHSLGAPREGELSACENKGDQDHQRLHHRDHHRETHGFLKELRQLVVEAELVEPEHAWNIARVTPPAVAPWAWSPARVREASLTPQS